MGIEYFEIHQAEWEAEQACWQTRTENQSSFFITLCNCAICTKGNYPLYSAICTNDFERPAHWRRGPTFALIR